MDENTSLGLMQAAGSLNPKLTGMAGDYRQEMEARREHADLQALSPIYMDLYTNPTEAARKISLVRPRSAKGLKAHIELLKSIRDEGEVKYKELAAQEASDPAIWKPVEYEATIKKPDLGHMEGGEMPTIDETVKRSRPARPMDVLERMSPSLRSRGLDTVSKVWSMQHAKEGDQLAADLDAKRQEIEARGLSIFTGQGADEFRQYYAQRNPGSALAQRIFGGDLSGDVPPTNIQAADLYDATLTERWNSLEPEERQLLATHYAMTRDSIATLRIDPRSKPQQALARNIEFARQVTAAKQFNERMGFRNKEFIASKDRFDQAMRLRRESLELRRTEAGERSANRKQLMQQRRFNIDRQSERLAIQAFNAMQGFLFNLRSMGDADPMVQRMREVARQMMQLYQSEFPGLTVDDKGRASVTPRPTDQPGAPAIGGPPPPPAADDDEIDLN